MMYAPWTKEALADCPYVDGLDLSQGVDCLRGVWDQDRNALSLSADGLVRDPRLHLRLRIFPLVTGRYIPLKETARRIRCRIGGRLL